jgi:predicted nucleic acid-binding protein
MSDPVLVFVDTHVLLHGVDDADPTKRDQARQWLAVLWTRRCGRLSTQVLNEFYNKVRKTFSGAVSAGDARAEVRRYQNWNPWQIDHATVEAAWAVEARFGLSWWDALIVAAAQQQRCRYLLAEDLPHGLRIDGLQILNPFLVGPDVLDAPAA